MLKRITYKDIMSQCNVSKATAKRLYRDIKNSLSKPVPFLTLGHLHEYLGYQKVSKSIK